MAALVQSPMPGRSTAMSGKPRAPSFAPFQDAQEKGAPSTVVGMALPAEPARGFRILPTAVPGVRGRAKVAGTAKSTTRGSKQPAMDVSGARQPGPGQVMTRAAPMRKASPGAEGPPRRGVTSDRRLG